MMASRVLADHIFQYLESDNNNAMKTEITRRITTSSPLLMNISAGKNLWIFEIAAIKLMQIH